jgi:uncharacterized protein (DUF58 family)
MAAATVSVIAGRLLGLEDLFLVGAGLFLLLGLAAIYVRIVKPNVVAARRVLPARVHAGASSRVELSLVNRSAQRSPLLSVRDPFDQGARWARFLVAPLLPGELARAAYRLPTEQRGVFNLGPLGVSLTDPFGLVMTTVEAAPLTRLTVYPRIDVIAPPPSSHGDDPLAGADHPRAFTGGGEDFYALRPYVRGDDLRRVHWASTAKTGELMLRQDEMPWQSRSTILLDTRTYTCPPPALEILVSAAASLVVAAARHDALQRLITTAGYNSRTSGGSSHVDTILEQLAGVRATPGQLVPALGSIRRSQTGGALVVLMTSLAARTDLDAIATMRSHFASVTLVLVEPSAWGAAAPPAGRPRGIDVIAVTGARPFAAAWSAAMGPARNTISPSIS